MPHQHHRVGNTVRHHTLHQIERGISEFLQLPTYPPSDGTDQTVCISIKNSPRFASFLAEAILPVLAEAILRGFGRYRFRGRRDFASSPAMPADGARTAVWGGCRSITARPHQGSTRYGKAR
jgi:hypothetical protein